MFSGLYSYGWILLIQSIPNDYYLWRNWRKWRVHIGIGRVKFIVSTVLILWRGEVNFIVWRGVVEVVVWRGAVNFIILGGKLKLMVWGGVKRRIIEYLRQFWRITRII